MYQPKDILDEVTIVRGTMRREELILTRFLLQEKNAYSSLE
jgi:hypothetical protein